MPLVDAPEQPEMSSWIRRPLMLKHWRSERLLRQSVERGARVAWYDDSSLYYGAPAEVLAQGDIVVATTGVFE